MKLVYTNTNTEVANQDNPTARVIAITSGKGGVGKTNAATNLALSLSALGKKVCVFDADASLANINILLGIHPEYTLEHLLNGEKKLKQIIVDGPRGIKVVPAASGIAECANLSAEQRQVLISALDELQSRFDYLIIDTAAGISDQVLDFVQSAQYAIVVITPEPTSLTDAFSLLKVLKRKGYQRPIYALVNMAMDFENSQSVFRRFESAVKKYISTEVRYLGYVKVDETIISSVSLQCPAVLLKPESAASQCFHALAEGIERQLADANVLSFSDYWKNLAEQTSQTDALAEAESVSESIIKEPELTFDRAMEFCSRFVLEHPELDESQQAQAEAFFSRYKESHGASLPEPVKAPVPPPAVTANPVADLYAYLEEQNFPESELRDLVSTLESLYADQHGKGLRRFDSTMVQLFSMAHGSESRMRELHQHMQQSFERQFLKPMYDVQQEFKQSLTRDELGKHEFIELLDEMRSLFQNRFNLPYRTPADDRVLELEALVSLLETQKADLERDVQQADQRVTEKISLLQRIKDLVRNEPDL